MTMATLKKAIDDGADDAALWQTHFALMAHHHKAIAQYRLVKKGSKRMLAEPPRTIVLWGPSGSGKSTMAVALAKEWLAAAGLPADGFFFLTGGSGRVWWDGYAGEEVVIVDEFHGWLPQTLCLRLCDVFPLTVEPKGLAVQCHAKFVIFTSNTHPRRWWPNIGLGAMTRRLPDIRYIDFSSKTPCPACRACPHAAECGFLPSCDAPPAASRGPKAIEGYVAADGSFIPLR